MMSSRVSTEPLSLAGAGQRVLHGQWAGDGRGQNFHSVSRTGKAKTTQSCPEKWSSSRPGFFFLGFAQTGVCKHTKSLVTRNQTSLCAPSPPQSRLGGEGDFQ